MVRINSINSVNYNSYNTQNKPSFKGEQGHTKPQELQNISPDFAIKTPMSYTKTEEINFPYETKAHCYKLANGQKVIIIPQEGETVVKTYVNAGSMNETDNIRGISHYIEHNLFNGSEGLENGDFFKQVDKMGAYSNASTGFAETNYIISSNLLSDGDLEKKIKLHASMLQTPRFAIEKLEKEKGIVNSEINMITSDPQNIGMQRLIKNLYNIQTTSLDLIGGTTDNITNLTREDVTNYYNNNYYPANMVTVITGEVKPEETMQIIAKYFNSKKQPPKTTYTENLSPIQKTIREDIISDKATATNIMVGFNSPTDSKERIYAEALTKLLSNSNISRISKSIKSENANTYAFEEKVCANPKDTRAIIITSESTDENSEKILKKIFTEIGNIANNPPTDEEMQIIKKSMLNGFSNTFESSLGTNTIIGTVILENNKEYIKEYEQIVKSMTAQDLVNVAKKYFDVNKAAVTLVHPANISKEQISKNHANVSFTGNKKVINLDDVKEYNTENNYRVTTLNSKTDNVNICFDIGLDKFCNQRPAAADVLNILLKEGSLNKNQNAFDTELAKSGIDLGRFAGNERLTLYTECNNEDLTKAMKSMQEVLENPRFTQEEFVKAKSRCKDYLLTSQKSAYDKLDQEIYKNTPMGHSKDEVLKDLETLTLQDVKDLYQNITQNGKGRISISAPFNRKPELKQEFFANLQQFKPVQKHCPDKIGGLYQEIEETKVLTDTDNKNQAEIIQAYTFKVNGNIKDNITLDLLNTILGGNSSSRLFMDLREKEKLAYHVRSNIYCQNDLGTVTLKIGTTTDNKETKEQSFENLQKSIDGFNRHITKIKSEKVSEEELNNAKLALKNDILNQNHLAQGKNSSMLSGLRSEYGISKINQTFDMIDKITAEDINNAANYIFAGKPIYSILATEDTLKANEKYLEELKKREV